MRATAEVERQYAYCLQCSSRLFLMHWQALNWLCHVPDWAKGRTTAMTGSMFPGGVRPDGLPAALSDRRRIAAVLATGLLDTEPEQEFDDLADLAAGITGCERAFITLVDEDRSFWKSCVGVDLQQTGGRQHPVRESFCYFLV